ncbi:hypothetical protein [Lactobacillus sp. ESL0701]|uniref:hypothetical protein n=1 Tax=Lactobacillus sp. ESL0701 TaxID=2983217 RepID=UPI0023F8F7DB|nr:hypothetical protein [Lactobacillus sp. ESL0701]
MVYTKCAIGTVVKHKDIRGISYKNNSLGWYPANGQDSGIIGKVISIMGDL